MQEIAQSVLAALGGRSNVLTNTVCMTRLRVTLRNPQTVDFEALTSVPTVLGTSTRGANGLEVVFGPRVIDGIYHAFLALTGIAAGTDALFPMSRQESSLRVQINAKAQQSEDREETWTSSHMDPGDIDTLKDLFDDESEEEEVEEDPVSTTPLKLLVLNGPNVNMIGLGVLQGTNPNDFSTILELCKDTAQEEGFVRCVCLQSNHEGDLVDWVQDSWCVYNAIVINPTTYGPTSLALRDAIRSVGIPTAQVSLEVSNGLASCLDEVCAINIAGKGPEGYAEAIRELARICRS